jgi:vancomycin resistance protein YoaR
MIYAGFETLPGRTKFGGWPVGGMPVEEVRKQLNERLDEWEKQSVVLEAINGKGQKEKKVFALRELGAIPDRAAWLSVLDRLTSGSAWDKARYRWSMPREFPITYKIDEKKMSRAVEQALPWIKRPPVNAKRTIDSRDRVVYTAHQNAYRLDTGKLARRLKEELEAIPWNEAAAAEPIQIRLPLRIIEPEVTLDELKAEGIERKIYEFSTAILPGSPGRLHNISAAAKAIHGMILAPGDIFDYSKIIASAEKTYGFREAPVIIQGKLVPGIGGGICQVSSTLYNAVLRIGIEIVERRNHSLPVSYLPMGQDATYAEGYINFRFKNTTGRHLLIRTELQPDRLTVKLFGSVPEEVTYQVRSNVVKKIEPSVKYVKNASLPKGKRVVLQQGKPGYVVETYRIKAENGKAVQKELISKDTYQAQPAVIAVNPGDGDAPSAEKRPPAPPIVEDGIRGPVF